MKEPPKGMKPGHLIAKILAQGVVPNRTVPFPRRSASGEVIANVYVRLLDQNEEDCALANAAIYVEAKLKDGKNLPWKAEDLEHNARCAEILAAACRDPEDPEQPFFECHVADTRRFTTDELSQLMLVYAELKEESWPSLKELTEDEMESWVEVIAKGVLERPFSLFSRAKLERFAAWCVTSLVEGREPSETST